MKFLLVLVSCCGCQESGGVGPLPPSSEVRSGNEEMKSLVASVRRNYRRKRRGKLGGSGQAGTAEWKPSLCAILEDNVEMEKDKSETERLTVAKRKNSGSHKSRTRVRSYSHEFGGNSMQAMPTFSATPFMI